MSPFERTLAAMQSTTGTRVRNPRPGVAYSPPVALSSLFAPFPLERILYEDADLIVIDKPVNMSTHAPDALRHDDAVSRLGMAIAERDHIPAAEVYLGIHQRLDRDTSGVLMLTRR